MGGEIAGYRVHAALQRKARGEQSCLTSPGLKTEQATQALLTLGWECRRDIHSCLSAFRFFGSGTQSPSLATWLDSTGIICPLQDSQSLTHSLITSWEPPSLLKACSHHLCSDLPSETFVLSATTSGARPTEELFLLPVLWPGWPCRRQNWKLEKTNLTKRLGHFWTVSTSDRVWLWEQKQEFFLSFKK